MLTLAIATVAVPAVAATTAWATVAATYWHEARHRFHSTGTPAKRHRH
ncbi:hypothetical protein [Nocardia aurantia]|uniref:Uncharacterized protein n=1 Tax=Nocardia aurantia TaxID=2585199 RepID=A0A7K0DGB7_9NOCA|nr:hypothetical protein [Nocardia aurantia]MQY24855.1 hypothetical protein [Nocardia aurantia]